MKPRTSGTKICKEWVALRTSLEVRIGSRKKFEKTHHINSQSTNVCIWKCRLKICVLSTFTNPVGKKNLKSYFFLESLYRRRSSFRGKTVYLTHIAVRVKAQVSTFVPQSGTCCARLDIFFPSSVLSKQFCQERLRRSMLRTWVYAVCSNHEIPVARNSRLNPARELRTQQLFLDLLRDQQAGLKWRLVV